jgi:hypothetical protein
MQRTKNYKEAQMLNIYFYMVIHTEARLSLLRELDFFMGLAFGFRFAT